MDFDGGGIGVDQSEMWEWQSPEFDLQKDLLPAPCSLWAETNSVVDPWSMFDEQTPIKECADIDLPFCDIGDITIKDFDEGKETLQAKRRRMLQFCPENVEMDFPTTDGLSESLQVNLDFSGDEHLLLTDGTEEQIPEEWLVDCSQDSVPSCPPATAEMNSPPSASVQANVSALQICSVEEQSNKTVKKPSHARPTPLKAGRNILRARKLKASVAYPFELIKPCGFRGDTTLRDINQRIHAPPLYKIRHKYDNAPVSCHEASAISGKPVVHKTKIHTEGGKGSITITRTRG
uniref:Uncharacterized protein n=1 Tax=Avena sativa TaxID=4498 RepID=A0ACD5XJI7_AVESA